MWLPLQSDLLLFVFSRGRDEDEISISLRLTDALGFLDRDMRLSSVLYSVHGFSSSHVDSDVKPASVSSAIAQSVIDSTRRCLKKKFLAVQFVLTAGKSICMGSYHFGGLASKSISVTL